MASTTANGGELLFLAPLTNKQISENLFVENSILNGKKYSFVCFLTDLLGVVSFHVLKWL